MKARSTRGVAVLGVTLLTGVLIAACGGGGSNSSTTNTSSNGTAAANVPSASSGGTTGSGLAGGFSAVFTKLEACAKKYGVSLPNVGGGRFPGAGATGATGFPRRFGGTGRFGGPGGRFFGATGASGFAGRGGIPGRFGATGGRGFLGGGFAGGLGAVIRAHPKLAQEIEKCAGLSGAFGRRVGPSGASGFNSSSSADRTEIAKFSACMKAQGINLPTPNFSGHGSVFGTKVNTSSTAFTTAYAKCRSDLTFLGGGGGGT